MTHDKVIIRAVNDSVYWTLVVYAKIGGPTGFLLLNSILIIDGVRKESIP